jgi:D-lyxose ketol-isomerase
MKRSEINTMIRDADAFLRAHQFHLPPFAYWGPVDWRRKGPEVAEIVERRLGWDITDFGSGDFEKVGLRVFTIRNGDPANLVKGTGKRYAEKILVVDVGQVTPLHYHWTKVEDIINRGGGELAIQLFNGNDDGSKQDDTPVMVSIDGVQRTLPAGGVVRLTPGESITLMPYCYHEFWAEGSRALIGEVSLVNDDNTDNCFYGQVGRFPSIDEDEAPLHLLVNDYERYWGKA